MAYEQAKTYKPGKEPTHTKCPKFEETVMFYFDDGPLRQRMLDFAAWLRDNKLPPSSGNRGYNWYIKYKGRTVCYIKIYGDTWHITLRDEIMKDMMAREDIKEALWESIFPCYGCNYGCYKWHKDKYTLQLFGREFEGGELGICRLFTIRIHDPDEKTLDALKEVLLANKNTGG
ncbi:MAG: hypothetical protein FWD16_02430 [Clostridia bacterium]|nr:hypothetical protein [Clostridia bacterium]